MAGAEDSTSGRLTPAAALSSVPLLSYLSARARDELAHLGTLRRFPIGTTLFEELDQGDSLHVVLSGYVEVITTSASGHEVELARLGPGEALGELAVIDGLPRNGSATAATDVATLVIDRRRFLNWLSGDADVAVALLKALSAKLRRTSSGMADLLALGLRARLAKRLLVLSQQSPTRLVTLTQQDLARSLGVTREAVNKELRSLEGDNVLRLGRGRIEIIDRASLESAAALP